MVVTVTISVRRSFLVLIVAPTHSCARQSYTEMSVNCFMFPADYCCWCFRVKVRFFLSVCLPHQSTTTNLCIPDFTLQLVLLYPSRFKSEPCVLFLSFFLFMHFVYFCSAWSAGHAPLLYWNNPRLLIYIYIWHTVRVCFLVYENPQHFFFLLRSVHDLCNLVRCNFRCNRWPLHFHRLL